MKQTLTISWGKLFPADPRFAANRGTPITLVIPDRLLRRPDSFTAPQGTPSRQQGYSRLASAIDRALQEPLAMASRPNANHPRDPYLLEVLLKRGQLVTLVSDGQSATYRMRRMPGAMNPAAAHYSLDASRQEFICRAVARYAEFNSDSRAFTIPASSPLTPTVMSHSPSHWPSFEFLCPENWGFESPTSPADSKSKSQVTKRTDSPSLAASPADPNPPASLRWTAPHLFAEPTFPPKALDQSLIARPRYRDIFDAATASSPSNPGRGDPSHLLPRLRQARIEADYSVRATDGNSGNLAPADSCFRLALALGRARLFGVEMPAGDDFTLTPAAAAAAATVLYRAVRRASAAARELPRHMRLAGAYGRRDVALELLELRTDAWAVYLAIDEALSAELYELRPQPKTKPTTDHAAHENVITHNLNAEVTKVTASGHGTAGHQVLAKRVGMLNRAIENLDANLTRQIAHLRPAAGTQLLENWRRLLAPEHRELLPWWLGGCLEEAG